MSCENEIERCPNTIDLEEMIMWKNENEATHIRAKVTYQSGRVEEFEAKLKADGTAPIKFQKRVSQLKAFPSVTEVKTEKFTQ